MTNTPISYEQGQAAFKAIHDALIAHLPETERNLIGLEISFKGHQWAPILTVSYYIRENEAAQFAEVLKSFALLPVSEKDIGQRGNPTVPQS